MTSEEAIKEAEKFLASQRPDDFSSLSDEELIRHLPDEVLLAHIQGQSPSPERTTGILGKVPVSQYAQGQRNIVGNIFERPAAAIRGGIQALAPGGETPRQGYVRGAINPGTIPGFQQQAIEAYYQRLAEKNPGQDPSAIQRFGGLVPSAAGLAADIVTNPADVLTATLPKAPGIKQGLQAVAQSRPGQAVGRFLTKERSLPKAPHPIDYLRGNPQAIEEANKGLSQAAHQEVLRFRQRGNLHDQLTTFLHHKAEEAWAPMKQVTASIPNTISVGEIKAAVASRLMNDPARIEAVNLFLDDILEAGVMPKTGRSAALFQSASDWSDLSSEVGQMMRKAGLQGKAAKSFSDLVKMDLRSGIADVLEAKAPDSMKGLVAEAKFNWGNYAADRDILNKYLAPGAVPNVPTNQGTAFLVKAAKGQLNPSEQDFLNRLQGESGIDVVKNLTEYAK